VRGVVIIVEVVDVIEVLIAKGCREASKSSLMSAEQNTSPFSGVAGPPLCYPSPFWLALMTDSSVMLGVVGVVILVVVAEVDILAEVVDEPLELKWLMKVR